jgi:hypothetical protein
VGHAPGETTMNTRLSVRSLIDLAKSNLRDLDIE